MIRRSVDQLVTYNQEMQNVSELEILSVCVCVCARAFRLQNLIMLDDTTDRFSNNFISYTLDAFSQPRSMHGDRYRVRCVHSLITQLKTQDLNVSGVETIGQVQVMFD